MGASPSSPADFVFKLLTKDKGWLAAYFDGLSRVNQTRQAYFTEPQRLRRFYEALRGVDSSADAARPAFRPAPGLLLLLSRLSWGPNGEPLVPGNLEVWKEILRQKSDSKIVHEWGRRAGHFERPEQLVEAMFAVSRVPTDAGPLQTYLLLSAIDSRRPAGQHLSPETVRLMAANFSRFSDQYRIFSEFPEVNDASIVSFVQAADLVDKISNHTLRGNAMGTFQANVGLWQILARQGQIPEAQLNDSWQGVVKPFAGVTSATQLFDAGCASLRQLAQATTGRSSISQYDITELLAGPRQTSVDGQRMHQELADRARSVLDGQRLVSLDTVMNLGDGLRAMKPGQAGSEEMVRLAAELREFEMPRPIFTSGERTEWAAGIYNNHHTDLQMRTDLTKIVKSPASSAQLEEARGQLAPFLRDTLVGLNYAYYEPPGAQILHNNPLFVRSHDFSGDTVAGVEHLWRTPQLFGEGTPAGGGAHLVGSLADLPYVLSEVEEDFVVPQNVQALIWRELVPGLLSSAILARWWNVSPNELHAVTLYQRSGEELLAASVGDEALAAQDDGDSLRSHASPKIGARRTGVARGPTGGDSSADHAGRHFLSGGRISSKISRRHGLVGHGGAGAGKPFPAVSGGAELGAALTRFWRAASHIGAKLRPRIAQRETFSRLSGLLQPLTGRIVGFRQPVLGAASRRNGLFAGDVKPSGPRAYPSHGGEDFRDRVRRCAGHPAGHAGNRG